MATLEKVSPRNIYAMAELTEQKTWQYLKEAWKRCPHCKAKPHFQYLEMYQPIFRDALIFCGWCCSYLGTWEEDVEDLK